MNVSEHLKLMEFWLNDWWLVIAAQKCQYIVFFNSYRRPDELELIMYGKRIQRCKVVTFLGIVIDEKLRYNDHMLELKRKCATRINVLRIAAEKHRRLTTLTLVRLYETLVRSLFEYATILVPCLREGAIEQLQVLQNAALRVILHLPFDPKLGKHVRIEEMHNKVGLVRVKQRLEELSTRYISSALATDNPIITQCLDEELGSEPAPSMFDLWLDEILETTSDQEVQEEHESSFENILT